MRDWVQPAADRCNIRLEAESWDGDYGALTARIRKGINYWDLVHVEAHYVQLPEAQQLFASMPSRRIPQLEDGLEKAGAVPVLEYGYVLAYRADSLRVTAPPTWATFWDTTVSRGRRGVREDTPVGNIEIALLSLGRDPQTVLYAPQLSDAQVDSQVDVALRRFDAIKPRILWWKTGDQLQKNLKDGDVAMAAAWSGRVLSAHRDRCPGQPEAACVIRENAATALVSTDWWVIPKGSPDSARANALLECLYADAAADGAKAFSNAQGYRVPMRGLTFDEPLAQEHLRLGSTASPNKAGRISEQFWGKHFERINQAWTSWRLR